MDDYVQTKGYAVTRTRHYCDVVRDHCQQVTKQNTLHGSHISKKVIDGQVP